jgi:sugar-specific transcriptional regulator TrmB
VPINAERIRKLMEFGLTEYQARVYLTLLDLGGATASQIPPLSRVPRTRIYATMQQLHEKGLVEILPESPLRYKAVPFAAFLRHMAEELRNRASQIDVNLDGLSREFAILAREEPEEHGRFEAIYGRRNVRERLIKMYESAVQDAIGIGTTKSPGRIMAAFGSNVIEKSRQGVKLRYAFFFTPDNRDDVKVLLRHAEVRHIDFMMPVYMHVIDGREFLITHPIPDDESYYRGEDIAIWTDDPAIARAMSEMAQKIWESGIPASEALAAEARGAKRPPTTAGS